MSNKILDLITTESDAANNELNSFQVLWNKIEKFESRNKKAEIKVDKLHEDYQVTVMPHEKKFAEAHCSLVEHLISFIPSNDLNKKDKARLFDYLDDSFDNIESALFLYDQKKVDELKKATDKYHKQFFDKERKKEINTYYNELNAMLKMAVGDDIDLPGKELKAAMLAEDIDKIEDILNQYKEAVFEKCNQQSNQEKEDWDDFEFNYYSREDDESSKVTEVFKASQLNKMYKKIANVIHPDKELDPAKKDEKHSLMQSLIKAKDEGDVFTLIKLYQEFVPNGEYYLDDSAMMHIEHLLQMRIQKLNQAHRDIFNGQGYKSYVWKRYSSTSRKKTLQKMEYDIKRISARTEMVKHQVTRLNTAGKVKRELKHMQH